MAKSQENDTKILSGLKDYRLEEVREDKERVVVKGIVGVKETACSIIGAIAEGFTVTTGDATIMGILTTNDGNNLARPCSKLTEQTNQTDTTPSKELWHRWIFQCPSIGILA